MAPRILWRISSVIPVQAGNPEFAPFPFLVSHARVRNTDMATGFTV